MGGSFVGLGTWSFLEEYSQTNLPKVQSILDIVLHISLALIFVGLVIFSMSFAGCLGALRENLCLLKLVSKIRWPSWPCFVMRAGAFLALFQTLTTQLTLLSFLAVLAFVVTPLHRRDYTVNGCICFSELILVLPERSPLERSADEISRRRESPKPNRRPPD